MIACVNASSQVGRAACIALILTGCGARRGAPGPAHGYAVVNALPAYGNPMWSPDGQRLYFNHMPLRRIYESQPNRYRYEFVDSLDGVYVADVFGRNQRRVYPHGVGAPELDADGRFLYYEHYGQIWRVSFRGDSVDPYSPIQVTSAQDGAFEPSISSRGTRLLYFGGSGADRGIYVTDASGGRSRHVRGAGWYAPDWRPNDSSFAFLGDGEVMHGIAVVDTFGNRSVAVRSEGTCPRWSPDGTRIAFLSKEGPPGVREQLWVVNSDGSQPRQLASDGVQPGFNWSPDGTMIAYVRFADDDTSYANGTIWIVNLATGERRQVTTNERP